jgi:hypothetical protein
MKLIPTIAVVLCGLLLTAGCTTTPGGDNNTKLKITINDGAELTNSTTVTLRLEASGHDFSQMSMSNDKTTWSSWEKYNPDPKWTLTPGDGPKIVYLKVRNDAHKESKIANASIMLDMTAPTVTTTIPGRDAANLWYILPQINLTFSEPMFKPYDDMCPVNVATPHKSNNFALDKMVWLSPTKLICRVLEPLQPNVRYTAHLDSGLIDVAGNHVKPINWSFSSRTASISLVTKTMSRADETTDIFGQVKNTDNCSFKDVDLLFDLRDALMGHLSYMNITFNHVLVPGAVWPFALEVSDKNHVVKNVVITGGPNLMEGETYTTEVPYGGLSLSNMKGSYASGNKTYTLTGDVKNVLGGSTARIAVYASFLNASHPVDSINLVATGEHYMGASLGAGMTTTFEIQIGGESAKDIADYSAIVVGEL